MTRRMLVMVRGLVLLGACRSGVAVAQAVAAPGAPKAVLVELFTSEGCSSCPPADELLRRVAGQKTAEGQLIVALSEHVSYWDGLGWKDPWSSEAATQRQYGYARRLDTEGPYTPQMVVNGREQFVGSDAGRLRAALRAEAARPGIPVQLGDVEVAGAEVRFTYSVGEVPAGWNGTVMAALVDDADRSSVLRGENSGRALEHVSVLRTVAPVGEARKGSGLRGSLPVPKDVLVGGAHRHLIVFVQAKGLGPVAGVDTKPL